MGIKRAECCNLTVTWKKVHLAIEARYGNANIVQSQNTFSASSVELQEY